MNFLNNLSQQPKRLFVLVSAALIVMFLLLLTPLITARTLGTKVTLNYQSFYVDPGYTLYPQLSLEYVEKDKLPCLLNSIFYYSDSVDDAYQQLDVIDTFYVMLEEQNGIYVMSNVLSSRPTEGVYLTADYAYLERAMNAVDNSIVWQDDFSGIRLPIMNGMGITAPQGLSQFKQDQILAGTATLTAYVYNGELYLVDFNL